MAMNSKNENKKDPHWKVPVNLPDVKPSDYEKDIDSGSGTAAPSDRDNKAGTEGFSPQLSGHGKADKSHTSSFDAGPPDYTLPGFPSGRETAPGPEEIMKEQEIGRKRQPTTSIAGRIYDKSEKPSR